MNASERLEAIVVLSEAVEKLHQLEVGSGIGGSGVFRTEICRGSDKCVEKKFE